jgi:hypothetical protein
MQSRIEVIRPAFERIEIPTDGFARFEQKDATLRPSERERRRQSSNAAANDNRVEGAIPMVHRRSGIELFVRRIVFNSFH